MSVARCVDDGNEQTVARYIDSAATAHAATVQNVDIEGVTKTSGATLFNATRAGGRRKCGRADHVGSVAFVADIGHSCPAACPK